MEITPATSSANNSSPTYDNIEEEEEEEEEICRICRNTGEDDNPLRYPCACSGSIKFVHQNCLLQWLHLSNNRHCEVCKHAFAFCPVYAEDAPSRLPLWEFVLEVGKKTSRLCSVLLIWLLIIPLLTFWICRLAFVRSFSEANRIFLSHMSFNVILVDCLHGFLISTYTVGVFLVVTFLRYCFRRLRELERLLERVEMDEGDQNGARVVRMPIEQGNRNLDVVDNVDDVGGAQGIAVAGQVIQINAENVAAQFWRQAARLQARVEQIFDGPDDNNDAEDAPFNEFVGIQGPVFHFPDALTIFASTVTFVGAFIFVPFSLGRLILYYVTWFITSVTSPVSTVMPLSKSALSLANNTLRNVLMAAIDLTFNNSENNRIGQVNEMMRMNASILNISSNASNPLTSDNLKRTMSGTSSFSDLTTLAVGYMFSLSLVFLCFAIFAFAKYTRRDPLVNGRSQGIASTLNAVPLSRQLFVCMRHLMTMIKVSFLLVIELWVFPLMCGWWLDVCTITIFGKSLDQRVEFFSVSPFTSSLVHWAVGIFYMLQISIFLSLLREVLRTGVIYFVRDPDDPNYHPFRDQIDDPVSKHAGRVSLSVAIYGSLTVMLVFLPVKLAKRMVPSMFPLDLSVSDPFTEIPVGILLLQICIPFAIEYFKVRTTIMSLLRFWFTSVGRALGLTDCLLPRPEDIVVNAEAGMQVRLRGQRLGGVVLHDQGRLLLHPDAPIDEFRDSANSDMSEEFDVEEKSDSERYDFISRIILLLVAAWMTILVINSALVVIPVALGRLIFNAAPDLPITHGVKCNDLYAFTIGSYLIWMGMAWARYTVEQIKSRKIAVLFRQIYKWCSIVLRSSPLLAMWIFVIPVLIGLLFELLFIVPIRVPVDESPVFLLYQNWTLGLILLKIWTNLVMLELMIPLVGRGWRMKFQRVRENGFSRLQGMWVLQDIILPIILKLLTALCVPYVLARGAFPICGYPVMVNSYIYRFSWLGCLCLSACFFCVKKLHVLLTNLHNSIRDERYLIGRRLRNIEEITDRKVGDGLPSQDLQRDFRIGPEVDMGLMLRHRNVVNMELLIQFVTVMESYLRLWPFPG